MNKTKGIVYTVIAAVIFGFTPILARIAYEGGSNGVNMTFLRAVLSLPVLFAAMLAMKIPFSLTRRELLHICITGGLGFSSSILLLYCSYNYIAVGVATTLHFIYPLLVAVGGIAFFHEKLDRWKGTAVVAGTAGILLFLERGGTVSVLGIVLSLLSGIGYAFHVVYLEQSGLKDMHYFKLSFYLCVVMAAVAGVYGAFTGDITMHMTTRAWVYSLLVSLFVSVAGISLLQLGIRYVGATTASLLTTLEPITSVICGILLLGESLSGPKLAGCILIMVAVLLIAKSPNPVSSAPDNT